MNMTQPAEPVAELSRVARKRARRVNEILRVAAEVLGERGYQGTSLEEVADRLDLAKASLYHYFDSKEALFSACLGTVAEDAIVRLGAIAAGDGTATERLRALIIEQQVITGVDYPELARLFLRHLEWPASIDAKIHDWHTRHFAAFKDVIDEGLRSGEFTVLDERVVRQCLIGTLNFVPFWLKGSGKRNDRAAIALVADTALLMFGVPVPS